MLARIALGDKRDKAVALQHQITFKATGAPRVPDISKTPILELENGDVDGAIERLKTIKVHPLNPAAGWTEPTWIDQTLLPRDQTPTRWDGTLRFWQALHEVVNTEPPLEESRAQHGNLAALGIAEGQPSVPTGA